MPQAYKQAIAELNRRSGANVSADMDANELMQVQLGFLRCISTAMSEKEI